MSTPAARDADPEPTHFEPTHFEIASIVEDLRKVRSNSLTYRKRGPKPTKLPSRKALIDIIQELFVVLFPNRLGQFELDDDGLDYFVGHTLDVTLRALRNQIEREVYYAANDDAGRNAAGRIAHRIVAAFGLALPRVRAVLETDIRAAFEGDPAARSVGEILACYPGITAIIHHRLAHELLRLGAPLVGRMIAEIAHSSTGVDIHPGAQIGSGFFIDHGTGVVIGETTVIGDRVRLYQAVTLGAKRFPVGDDGKLIKGIPRHPIVEDDVVVYAGATILGRVTIGRGSTIGGNVWLTQSVPPGTHLTQAQSRQTDGADPGT